MIKNLQLPCDLQNLQQEAKATAEQKWMDASLKFDWQGWWWWWCLLVNSHLLSVFGFIHSFVDYQKMTEDGFKVSNILTSPPPKIGRWSWIWIWLMFIKTVETKPPRYSRKFQATLRVHGLGSLGKHKPSRSWRTRSSHWDELEQIHKRLGKIGGRFQKVPKFNENSFTCAFKDGQLAKLCDIFAGSQLSTSHSIVPITNQDNPTDAAWAFLAACKRSNSRTLIPLKTPKLLFLSDTKSHFWDDPSAFLLR